MRFAPVLWRYAPGARAMTRLANLTRRARAGLSRVLAGWARETPESHLKSQKQLLKALRGERQP